MRKTALSCAKSTAFRFAARRARFSGFMSCALVGRLFAQDCVSVFFRMGVYPVRKEPVGSGEMGL